MNIFFSLFIVILSLDCLIYHPILSLYYFFLILIFFSSSNYHNYNRLTHSNHRKITSNTLDNSPEFRFSHNTLNFHAKYFVTNNFFLSNFSNLLISYFRQRFICLHLIKLVFLLFNSIFVNTK